MVRRCKAYARVDIVQFDREPWVSMEFGDWISEHLVVILTMKV